MTTDIFPAGVNSQGHNTWIITFTNPVNTAGTGVTLATLTGATAVDLTCYLGAEDQEIGFEQEREDDTRACDENKREEFGTATFSKDRSCISSTRRATRPIRGTGPWVRCLRGAPSMQLS